MENLTRTHCQSVKVMMIYDIKTFWGTKSMASNLILYVDIIFTSRCVDIHVNVIIVFATITKSSGSK